MTEKRKVTIEIPISDAVGLNPDRYGGFPCIGTRRIPISQIAAELAEGSTYNTVEEYAEDRDLPVQDVRDALMWAAAVLDQRFTNDPRRDRMSLEELTEGIWVVRDKANGLWWRPKANGYTQELAAAGICNEETAKNWAMRKSPNRHGDYQDEATPLSKALKGLDEGTVLRELLSRMEGDGLTDRERAWAKHLADLIHRAMETDLPNEIKVQGLNAILDGERRKFAEMYDQERDDVAITRLEVANEDKRKLSEQGKRYRARAEAAEEMLEYAKAAALELRDAWVPKEKHTEFPWEQ